MGDVDKKVPNTNGLVTTTFLHTKISKLITKYQILVTTTVLNTKISEVGNKIPDKSKYIATQEFCCKIKTS